MSLTLKHVVTFLKITICFLLSRTLVLKQKVLKKQLIRNLINLRVLEITPTASFFNVCSRVSLLES